MADALCWDGGDNTWDTGTDTWNPGTHDWTTAYDDIQTAITAAGAGGTVYLASDHSETPGTSVTLTLPAAGSAHVTVVSVDRTTNQYTAATAAQLDVSSSSYSITLDGNGAFYGAYFKANNYIYMNQSASESIFAYEVTFENTAINRAVVATGGIDGYSDVHKCKLIASGTANNFEIVQLSSENSMRFSYCDLQGASARTGDVFQLADNTTIEIIGTDFSVLTNLNGPIVTRDANTLNWITIDGCKLPDGVAWLSTATYSDLRGALVTRSDDNNFGILHNSYFGQTVDSAVYRTGGASDGTNFSWLVTTTAVCNIGTTYVTPWINVWVSDTGSTTFDSYIANNSADLTDTECWLEVEYFATASSTVTSIATDRAANIIGAGTAQTDDSSTWNGATLGYPQKLSVTATLGKAGMCRARVVFAAASKTVYVDPLVTVS